MDLKMIFILLVCAATARGQVFITPSTTQDPIQTPTPTFESTASTAARIQTTKLTTNASSFTTPTAKLTTSTSFPTTPTTKPKTTTKSVTPTSIFITPTTTIPSVSKGSCSCQRLHVSGPEKFQAAAMGSYQMEKCLYNNKPLYKHTSRNLFMYFSTQNVWAVGLAPDQGLMVLRVGDMAETPTNVTLDWSVLDGLSTMLYKTEPNVTVTCGCQAYTCARLSMTSRLTRASLSGEFVRAGELNGRPTYVNSDHGVYLYLKRTPTCAYWAIGPTLGGDSALMVTNDVSPTPEDITTNWNVHYKTGTRSEWARADVTLTCLSKTA